MVTFFMGAHPDSWPIIIVINDSESNEAAAWQFTEFLSKITIFHSLRNSPIIEK